MRKKKKTKTRGKRVYLANKQHNLYNKKKKPSISPIAVGIVLAFILLTAAIGYSAVDAYRKKNLVKSYINNAASYTESQNYTAAIEEYNKALKIGSGSKAEIYRGIVYCHLKNGDTDEAEYYTNLLLEKREIKNENFSEIVLMINEVDPKSAYNLLKKYTELNGSDNESIKKLVESSEAAPAKPVLDMLQGTYVKLTSIKFKPDNEHFGNIIYYTKNGEAPNEVSSMIYRGGFPAEESIELRAIAFNSNGERSEISAYSFTVDKAMLELLQELIAKAKELSDTTVVGVDTGQCTQASKDKLNAVIDDAVKLLERDNVLFMDAENRVDYLNEAIAEFESRINKNVDKSTLDTLEKFADEVYSAVSKSSIANNVSGELKQLKSSINACASVTTAQASIDKAYHTLYRDLLNLNFAGYKAAYKALLISNDCNNYIIYDVNNDMIPELILNMGTTGENYFYTYSVQQGEAVRIANEGNFNTLKQFYNEHTGLLGCTTEDGNGEFYLITFVNNKLVISDKLDKYNTNETLRTSLAPVTRNLPGTTQPIDEF